jgi:3-phenylpropionate/trans-cinnamate dioxygenase ferredoxin subunit
MVPPAGFSVPSPRQLPAAARERHARFSPRPALTPPGRSSFLPPDATVAKEGRAMADWVDACARDDVDLEDVIRFDHGGRTYAIYRSPEDEFFATDGLCTHEQVHLADGLVMDHLVECPKHNGQFDYTTGEARRAPVCVNLATYPVRVEDGRVLIALG